MHPILDAPMSSNERQKVPGIGLLEGKIGDAMHDLVALFARFEQSRFAFQAKDLLDTNPAVGHPLVEFGTTDEMTMFQATMTFVPALRLVPAPIGGRVTEKIAQILCQGRLIVFGHQKVVASKAIDPGTQFGLGRS